MNLSTDRDNIAIPSKSFAAGEAWTISFWAKKSLATKQWSMIIGEAYSSTGFDMDGQIDEVWIHDETLSATQIAALYQKNDTNGFALKSDNLHFDANGQQSLGSSFAEESAYYSWMIETFQASDIAAGLAEPGADRDGDGQTNRQEFLAASEPLSATSFFKSGFIHNGNTSGQISYESSSARMYEVQRFAETNQAWVIELPPLRGTGTTVTRPLVLSGPRNFYRVRSSLP